MMAFYGFSNTMILTVTKISVPTIKNIIKEWEQNKTFESENIFIPCLKNVVKTGYYPNQSQFPIQKPYIPDNPSYTNTRDNYFYQCYVEHEIRIQREEDLRQEREQYYQDINMKDQQINDLTSKLNQKAYDIQMKDQQINDLTGQLNQRTYEVEDLKQLNNKYIQNEQKTNNDLIRTKEEARNLKYNNETLLNENNVLKQKIMWKVENSRQPMEMKPLVVSNNQQSFINNIQSKTTEPLDQKLDTKENNILNSYSSNIPMYPTTESGKNNDDGVSGFDFLYYGLIIAISFTKGFKKRFDCI